MNHIMYLQLGDCIRSARVREVPHPYHTLFHVLFEDGYENIFFNDVETGKWIEEDLGETLLAKLFGLKIKNFVFNNRLCPKILQWYKNQVHNKLIHFGFFKYTEDDCSVYEIYFPNLKFMYGLVKKGNQNWEIFGPYNLLIEEWKMETAKDIAAILDEYDTSL
jgi:hypothetical protein